LFPDIHATWCSSHCKKPLVFHVLAKIYMIMVEIVR
jgi:hypothetical protein